MSEYSDPDYVTHSGALRWAQTVHRLITESRVSAVDYMWGFFGSWDGHGAHSLVNIDFDGGVYRSHRLSHAYYLTGQYSRFVRPGYVRVDARSNIHGILVSAFKGPSEIVVVAINATHQPQPANFFVSGSVMANSVAASRTSQTERWRDLPAIMPTGSRFSGLPPAYSVTTFVRRLADTSSGQ